MRLLVVGLVLGAVALAQTDRGTITGSITDPVGAVVANAPLDLRGTETGVSYPAITSATGNYTFTQIPIGTYELNVVVPGFKKFTRGNIRVQASQVIPVDVQLELGSAAESVTVTSEVTLLRTDSSDVSTNVQTSRLTSLPILPIGNGNSSSHGVRTPQAAANLMPGVYFAASSNIRVNGAPSNTESVRVEGQDATVNVAGANFQSHAQPSVDALEEVAIQSSNYAAEYGQAGSGVFNYTVKSGTNQFHGSAYDYFSNEFLNASQAYNGIRPRTRRNDYGFTIGGPIRFPKIYDGRNRTFFFFNYEAFKENGMITTQSPTVPTDLYRQGNFASALSRNTAPITATGGRLVDSLGRTVIDGQVFDPATTRPGPDGYRVRDAFVGNIVPATRFDPSSAKVLALIPRPTSSGLINNYNNPFPTKRTTPIPALKIDHSFNSKAKISGYWSDTSTGVAYCVPLCSSVGLPQPIDTTSSTYITSNTERLNFDYTLTPTMLLHIGAGYQSTEFKYEPPTKGYDVFGQLGIKGATRGPDNDGRFPTFNAMTGGNSSGGMNAMGPITQNLVTELKPTFNTSLTMVRGGHTFKFGGEARTEGYIQTPYENNSGALTFSADQTANPWYNDAGVALTNGSTGFPFASFLLGSVNQVTVAAPAKVRGGRFFLGAFAQDSWKVNRKLTVDYGLRYDYMTYSREQYGRTPDFSATTPNSTAGGRLGAVIFEGNGPNRCGCSFAQNYPLAFGPRLGFAYQINSKTVVRGGFGVVYSTSPGGSQGVSGAAQTANAPGYGDAAFTLSQGYPVAPVWPDLRANLFPDPRSFAGQPTVIDQNAGRPARQFQWQVGIQREISRNLVVDVSYVANRGAWWRTNTLNQYNGLRPEDLAKNYGLDITNAADRTILAAQVGQPAAGRFQNKLPFAGFPTTFSVARSLLPYPQFANSASLSSTGPLGKTWYDSLQTKVTKRLSHGLDATYSFTWSKELQLGVESDTGGQAGQINDVFNRNANKSFSSFSRPFWMVLALNYTVPKVRVNRYANFILSDWTLGTVMQYGSGQPIGIPNTATINNAAALLRGTRAERVPGEPLFLVDLNCHCYDPAKTQVLNPKAWRDPVPGTFSTSALYYNDYRFQRRPRETLSFGRMFKIRENVRLQLRAEFTNPFNRTQIPNPVIGSPTGGAGNYTTGITTQVIGNGNRVNASGFGAIATQPATAVIGERSGLLVGRLTF